jgi:DNA-binding transcriptional ArsR family regulator
MKRSIVDLAELEPSCGAIDEAHQHTIPSGRPAASEAVLGRAARMLSAAGDPARLRLLELLADGERCVTDIAADTNDAMPTVSQRLQVLRREGLLSTRRDGKHVFYAVADQHVLDLITNILHHAEEPA